MDALPDGEYVCIKEKLGTAALLGRRRASIWRYTTGLMRLAYFAVDGTTPQLKTELEVPRQGSTVLADLQCDETRLVLVRHGRVPADNSVVVVYKPRENTAVPAAV
eukprot:Unigene4070_Nuclearia_a/m.12363 Unigene4070_Nuclearia_a/g.12363  ORF Unigene4070_Nuclearia_a/g.12363 Unigene4070_Nuclearia_a/m.12363 type:complete len:106 (+) Unigene4070_Nuclearia_a:1101-1418(+)